MIILPPESIQQYITLDENGVWIHDKSMPTELIPVFEDFIERVNCADKYKLNDYMK